MEKRGELTSSQIGMIILAIAGFIVVLLFLFFILDLKEMSELEICKLSILTRGTAPEITKRLAPLKCTTQKICLTMENKDCPQFLGYENVKKVKLPSGTLADGKPKASQKIEEISANAMYDCWNIMGQGKIDIFGGEEGNHLSDLVIEKAKSISVVNNVEAKCVICSRVAIAPDLYEEKNKEILKQVDVNTYLKEKQVPGSSLTYLQTFTDRQVSSYPSQFSTNFSKQGEGKTTDEIAFVFSQILVDGREPLEQAFEKGAGTGIAIGSGLLLTPLGKVVGLVGAKITIPAAIVATLTSGGLAYVEAGNNQELAVEYCGPFESVEQARYGCSVVTPAAFSSKEDLDKIENLCKGGIEGNL
ncbi:MAG: hypothetical protein KJ600_02255 [Nanoarchaeota archaeon]|nr:hypothetical protein [Nanoarchaeota archaeon]MBU1103357.1 hypothetical protein [Nanoarchaeota archaeon]